MKLKFRKLDFPEGINIVNLDKHPEGNGHGMKDMITLTITPVRLNINTVLCQK